MRCTHLREEDRSFTEFGSLSNCLRHWTVVTSYWTCMKSGISQRQLNMIKHQEKEGSLLAISIHF